MGVGAAMDVLVGPRGGKLDRAVQNPERRRAEFKGEAESTLHTFVPHDTSMPGLKNEQPWHRMAAYLIVAGISNKDIAEAAGVTTQSVSTLKAQTWFQELLATLSNKQGNAALAFVQGEALASVEKLVSLRDSAENENVQLNAAKTLLEQACGKPTQKILSVSATTSYSSPQEEAEEINLQLAALRRQKEEANVQSSE